MAKSKLLEVTEYKLVLFYKCPNCDKKQSVDVIPYDIDAYSSSCDLCGSHGSIDLSAVTQCPECNVFFQSIELSSW